MKLFRKDLVLALVMTILLGVAVFAAIFATAILNFVMLPIVGVGVAQFFVIRGLKKEAADAGDEYHFLWKRYLITIGALATVVLIVWSIIASLWWIILSLIFVAAILVAIFASKKVIRIIAIVVAAIILVVLIVLLVGCGSDANDIEGDALIETSETSETSEVILVVDKIIVEGDIDVSGNVNVGDDVVAEDDVIAKDDVVAEDDVIAKDDVVAEDDVIAKDDVVAEDDVIAKDDVVAEDDVIAKDDVVAEDDVIAKDDVVAEDDVIAKDDVVAEDDVVAKDDVVEENTEPEVSEPEVSEPEVSEPEVSEPEVSEPEHTHSYTAKITKEATCTDEGVRTYACTCGKSYTEAIAKLGHKYISTVIAPTTEAKGYTEHTCSRCGDSYKDNYTDKLPAPKNPTISVPTDYMVKGDTVIVTLTDADASDVVIKYVDPYTGNWIEDGASLKAIGGTQYQLIVDDNLWTMAVDLTIGLKGESNYHLITLEPCYE